MKTGTKQKNEITQTKSGLQADSRGFIAFDFTERYSKAIAAAERARERERERKKAERAREVAELRRARRGEDAYLMEIIDFPESALSRKDIEQLDAYIMRQRNAIRSSWSPQAEASRRSEAVEYVAKAADLFVSAGFCNATSMVQQISLSDLPFDMSDMLE